MGHRNARTTLWSRHQIVKLVESGSAKAAVARRFGISRQTVHKWWRRYLEGDRELVDRSSRPRRMPRLTDDQLVKLIIEARRVTGYGPARIAGELGLVAATVWKVLRRAGLSRLPRQPREPVRLYERARPGELLHVDVKKLGRFKQAGHRVHGDRTTRDKRDRAGWERVHVAIDDRTRVAYVEIADNETGVECAAFLERACDWYQANGIRIERVITDNAMAYGSNAWNDVCASRGIGQRRTRPYRPQTNGKAERFIRTMLNEWAYADAYESSEQRASTLARWCDTYNTRRYHTACKSTPWQRAASDLEAVNNVRRQYS